jgi:hypothetical protein
LGKPRALTASPAHDQGLGIGLAIGLPGGYSVGLGFAADQPMTQGNRCVVALLLIGGAYLSAFFVV